MFYLSPVCREVTRWLVRLYDGHPDQAGLKESDFQIVALDSSGELKNLLAGALGVRTVVRKERTVHLLENSRMHLDSVDGLGTFIELEVPVPDEASGSKAQTISSTRFRPSDRRISVTRS